jgi:hypothetical protein
MYDTCDIAGSNPNNLGCELYSLNCLDTTDVNGCTGVKSEEAERCRRVYCETSSENRKKCPTGKHLHTGHALADANGCMKDEDMS